MAKPRKSYRLWILGKVLYWLVGFAIFAMTAFLVWRVFFSGNTPSELDALQPNAALVAAYGEKGDDMILYTQEQSTHTRGEENYGYFAVPEFTYIPEAGQMQVLFRYNNSTLEATEEKYGLTEPLKKGEEVFDVSLVLVTDKTPDDVTDNTDGSANLEKNRIAPTSRVVSTTALYTYFVYVFDGVDIKEDTFAAFFDVYYQGDVNYESEAFGTLRLYHRDSEWIKVELTSKDKNAILDYQKN